MKKPKSNSVKGGAAVRVTRLVRRISILENALAAAADELRMLSQYRKKAHEYDRDVQHGERPFADEEDWDIMEGIAKRAKTSALLAIRPLSPNDPR
jgi:hypothetical protein